MTGATPEFVQRLLEAAARETVSRLLVAGREPPCP